MPELPEVETTVRGLRKQISNRIFIDVWTDSPKSIKKPKNFEQFKQKIKGKKILKIWRRGKNIILDLSENKILLIHQKLTGHLLFGEWVFKNRVWESKLKNSPLGESQNNFIRLIFFLDNGKMLALSDLRKFAKIELWEKGAFLNSKELKSLGPEPLEKTFTLRSFQTILKDSRLAHKKIKEVLMNQNIIAGIGNIYSDEILFVSQIHPLRKIKELKDKEIKGLYQAIKKALKKAVLLRGTSVSDFRNSEGKLGRFQKMLKVYRREGEKCFCCGATIKRLKMGGRSSHFCPQCQKL